MALDTGSAAAVTSPDCAGVRRAMYDAPCGAARRRVLVENPAALYGFEKSA
jgi:hypothetical protein